MVHGVKIYHPYTEQQMINAVAPQQAWIPDLAQCATDTYWWLHTVALRAHPGGLSPHFVVVGT